MRKLIKKITVVLALMLSLIMLTACEDEPISYTATFKADGVTVGEVGFTVESDGIDAPEVPEKLGYTGAWESFTLGTESITVNAVYTPINYTATFKADGETVSEVGFPVESEGISSPAVPEKPGYTGTWESFTLGTESITVNAVYAPITYTITYNSSLDVGENPNPTEYTVESEGFTLLFLSHPSYSFDGWFTDADFETPAITDVPKGSLGNIVLYAKWTAAEYTATFKAEGETVRVVGFTVESESIAIPDVPEKLGYTGTWESFTLGTESITVNAIYTPITYTATFKADGETVSEVDFTVESEGISSPAVPEKLGYTGVWESFTLGAESITVNAVYTPITYTATFKADGETVSEVTFTVETERIISPKVPEKLGYTGAWERFTLGAKSITVNAIYTPVTYKITYETNLSGISGGTLKTFTVESETFSVPSLSGDGYSFIGWYLDEALTVAADTEITKGTVGDVKLYAKLECTHSYKYTVTKKAGPLTDGVGTYTCSVCGDSYTENIPATKSIKILAIGNSYSVDATRYLYGILEDAGIENIRIVNMYIAGCPIDTHWENIQGDLSAYDLYESSTVSKTMAKDATAKRSISYAMALDDWDIVTLQQRSNYAGLPSKYGNLQNVIDYVKENEPNADIYWHMTWAYSPTRSENYPEFGRTQIGMYNAIVDTVESLILTNPDIAGVIPTGTAIQNLRTSLLGDDLTRDNTHLSYTAGRYTAAMIWAKALTGCDLTGITGTPSYSADNEAYGDEIRANLVYIKEAVDNAFETPFAVTDSIYPPSSDGSGDTGTEGGETEGGETEGGDTVVTPPEVDFDETLSDLTDDDIAYLTENGYSPSDYKLLDITFYDNEYYNSTGNSKRRVGTDNFLNTFVATEIFSRYEIVVGSIIRLDVGQYRPEAWTALDVKTPTDIRPANSTEKLTVVTEEWWGDFNYRAFNLRKSGSITSDEIISGFRIYIPVVKRAELTQDDISFLEAQGLNASEYKVLDFESFENSLYDSAGSSKLKTPAEGSTLYGRFIGIEMLTRHDLTVGSVIRLDSGFQYRPEGWFDLEVKRGDAEREPNTSASVTVVDLDWWKSYIYRGFNVSKPGAYLPDFDVSGIRIYVKI